MEIDNKVKEKKLSLKNSKILKLALLVYLNKKNKESLDNKKDKP